MSCGSRPEAWGRAVAGTLALVSIVLAPDAAGAQGWREVQAWGAALGSRPAVVVAGTGLALRDRGRTRVGASLGAGLTEAGEPVARVEALWHFLLDPGRVRGLAAYGGGGLAVTTQPGASPVGRLVASLGVEGAPARPRSLFVEIGVGGGARIALGVRWRARRAAGR